MSSAQRKEPRLRVRTPVIVSLGKQTVTTDTEDISYRGLYIPLSPDDLPPLRKLIRVEVSMVPGTAAFATHAMVIRHGDDYGKVGIGVEFFGRTESADWDRFVREAQSSEANAGAAPMQPPGVQPAYPSPDFAPPVMGRPGSYAPPPLPGPGFAPPPAPSSPPPPLPDHASAPPPAPPPLPRAPAATPYAPPYPAFAPPALSAPVIHGLDSSPPPERPSAPKPPPAPVNLPPGAERRRHAREPMPIEIRVRTQRSIHVAHGIDSSLGGISLCGADLALSIGEHVILNLAQPGTPLSFRIDAVVRRTVPAPHPGTYGYGLEFVNVEPVRQTLLSEFFDSARAHFR